MEHRIFLLPAHSPCEENCLLCQMRFSLQGDLTETVKTARSAGYGKLGVPVHLRSGLRSGLESAEAVRQEGARLVWQVLAKEVFEQDICLRDLNSSTDELEVIGTFDEFLALVSKTSRENLSFVDRWVLFWKPEDDLSKKKLPAEILNKLRLYVPYAKKNATTYYDHCTDMIEDFNGEASTPISPPDYDIHNDKISAEDREPSIAPTPLCELKGSQPKVSYIVPVYNSSVELAQSLSHLFHVDRAHTDYEVIVVDDGSFDRPLDQVSPWLHHWQGKVNLRWIEFPRAHPRRFWDNSFRAGIARNLGVKSALGEVLCFCDADILIPPDYTTYLLEAHHKADVIQARRRELPNRRTQVWTQEKVSRLGRHRSEFWQDFEERSSHWNSLENSWQYVSTYLLSVKREDFFQLGRFRTSFGSYGFEDTDLGHRAVKAGKKLFLSPCLAGHLSPSRVASEYYGSQFVKDLILTKSMPTFFVNNLDPRIYYWMQDYFSRRSVVRKWANKWPPRVIPSFLNFSTK